MNIFICLSSPINSHLSLFNHCVQCIESFRGTYWQFDAKAVCKKTLKMK